MSLFGEEEDDVYSDITRIPARVPSNPVRVGDPRTDIHTVHTHTVHIHNNMYGTHRDVARYIFVVISVSVFGKSDVVTYTQSNFIHSVVKCDTVKPGLDVSD